MAERQASEILKDSTRTHFPRVHYSEGTVDYPPGTLQECIAYAEWIAVHGVWDGMKKRFYPPSTVVFIEVKELLL